MKLRRVIAFWSCAGGVGTTTLAIELSAALACVGRHRTAVVELNLDRLSHFRYHLKLGRDPGKNLATVADCFRMRDTDEIVNVADLLAHPSDVPSLSVLPGLYEWGDTIHENLIGGEGKKFVRWLISSLLSGYQKDHSPTSYGLPQ